jgi:signal transduction histidine kinase
LNLTHELRSPLFAIGGIVRNLQRNIGRIPEKSIREQLNEAQAAIASINRDVDGLVQVFRSDLQELEPQFSAVEAADLIEAVKRRYPPEHTPAHQLQWTVPTGLEKLRCDPLLTQQILDNLVSNALRHTPGGAVRVTVARWGDEIRLRVEDEGPGIPVEDRQRIFDRHDTGTRPKASGFGVGLYLVKIYTKVQGGRVEVDDVPAGASFSIYLPIQEQA